MPATPRPRLQDILDKTMVDTVHGLADHATLHFLSEHHDQEGAEVFAPHYERQPVRWRAKRSDDLGIQAYPITFDVRFPEYSRLTRLFGKRVGKRLWSKIYPEHATQVDQAIGFVVLRDKHGAGLLNVPFTAVTLPPGGLEMIVTPAIGRPVDNADAP